MNEDRAELRELLDALDGVAQDVKFHPEGDALYHSLQAFDLARATTGDPWIWASALFHDVGKALDSATHDEVGADLLEDLAADRVVWLVRHHLDLLRAPRKTRARLRDRDGLRELTLLRRIDVAARRPGVLVTPLDEALDIVLEHRDLVLAGGASAPDDHGAFA